MANHPSEQSNQIPALFYDDAAAALAWLEKAFGFETRLYITDDKGGVAHAEMSYGGGRIMVDRHGPMDSIERLPGRRRSRPVLRIIGMAAPCRRISSSEKALMSKVISCVLESSGT